MKTEYSGIKISYDEGKDSWLFELRGRSRSAESLAKAKEAIDKEPKEKRLQAFPRFQAYLWHYNGMKVVTVTSIADGYYGSGTTFWVVHADGKRAKERDTSLYPVNEHNTSLIEKIKAKDAEAERIHEETSALKSELQKAVAPKELAA